jgi:1,4-dihydroxy-2-naphthoate octaprenyltransferase
MKTASILGPMRLPFVILTPMCVLLGIGTAYWRTGQVPIIYSLLAVIGAIAAHISVNAFNEYFDFKSGLDEKTHRTPFSGGSGTLQQRPELSRSAFLVASISLLITAGVGSFFLIIRGPWLLPLGACGVLIIVTYTAWLTHRPILCLIAPGLGFGPLMVMGTDFVLSGSYSLTAFVASLVPFFLVSNLLLLNQFPDVEADRAVGRRHLPIAAGRRRSSLVFGGFLMLTYLSIIAGVLMCRLPLASLLGLVTLAAAIPAAIGAFRNANAPDKLIPFMGMNVVINLATPALVATGMLIS